MNFLIYLNTIVSAIFSLLLVVRNFTLRSVIACILGLAFSCFLALFYFEFTTKKTRRSLATTRKMLSYLGLVLMAVFILSRAYLENSPHLMDVILGVSWFAIVFMSIIASWALKEKRIKKYFPDTPDEVKKKRSFISETLEWVDAAAWAVGIVLLLNIFVFQLYAIPSESMVPTFMIGDRVVGLKATSGPQFPLSSFRLPKLKKYKRGDVVILRSPRYPNTPESEFKTFISQLIYMLTFMQVNINTDPATGNPKIDPLVKRIVGLPGEKLMLVDGVLYKKTRDDADFKVVKQDEKYAQWDLEKLSSTDLQYVKRIPINSEISAKMKAVEKNRQAVDFKAEYSEIQKIINSISKIKKSTNTINNFSDDFEYSISDIFSNNVEIAEKILTTNDGINWLQTFSTSWSGYWDSTESKKASLYELRNAQLNVLIKKCFVKLILRNMQLLSENVNTETLKADIERQQLLSEATDYSIYLALSNGRNMNEFPKGENNYIPANEYFMMGDNRFNSHDLRHGARKNVPVDPKDSMPLLYVSSMAPQSLHDSKILGIASFKIWPFSRFGGVK